MRRTLLNAVIVAGLAFCGAACDNIDESIPTTPTQPTLTTDTLTGTVTINGAESKTFIVNTSGTITATITALARQDEVEQETALQIGMSMGTWNGAVCQIVLANDAAIQGTTLVGTATGSGVLCVRIYDVGKLPASVNYSIDVVHP